MNRETKHGVVFIISLLIVVFGACYFMHCVSRLSPAQLINHCIELKHIRQTKLYLLERNKHFITDTAYQAALTDINERYTDERCINVLK